MGAVHEGTLVVTIVHDCQVRPADVSLSAALGVGVGRHLLLFMGATRGVSWQCSARFLYPVQVVDIPEALLEDHDLTVDYILTPTRVIATGCARPKPTGILWSKVGHHSD